MRKLVLLRHGQSLWNLENRFTGWTDVDLSDQGILEVHRAGKLLREEGYIYLTWLLPLILNVPLELYGLFWMSWV